MKHAVRKNAPEQLHCSYEPWMTPLIHVTIFTVLHVVIGLLIHQQLQMLLSLIIQRL